MFDLHTAIRSCKVLFSISNAFIKLGCSQLSSFSAFTAKKKARGMLINNFTTHPYAVCTLNDKFGFSIREPCYSYKFRSRENVRPFHVFRVLIFARTWQSITNTTWISIKLRHQKCSKSNLAQSHASRERWMNWEQKNDLIFIRKLKF